MLWSSIRGFGPKEVPVRKAVVVLALVVVLSGCVTNVVEPILQAPVTPVPTILFIPPVPLAEYADWCSTLEGSDRFTDEALSKCGCPACDKVPSFGGLPAECDAKCR
jgi:hypothetical protein